jgi:hypothetical protein
MAVGFGAAWSVVNLSLDSDKRSLLISQQQHGGHHSGALMSTLGCSQVAMAALAWADKKSPFG